MEKGKKIEFIEWFLTHELFGDHPLCCDMILECASDAPQQSTTHLLDMAAHAGAGTGASSVGVGAGVGAGAAKKPFLVINLDANETVLFRDDAGGKSTVAIVNEIIAECAWGRVTSGDGPHGFSLVWTLLPDAPLGHNPPAGFSQADVGVSDGHVTVYADYVKKVFPRVRMAALEGTALEEALVENEKRKRVRWGVCGRLCRYVRRRVEGHHFLTRSARPIHRDACRCSPTSLVTEHLESFSRGHKLRLLRHWCVCAIRVMLCSLPKKPRNNV